MIGAVLLGAAVAGGLLWVLAGALAKHTTVDPADFDWWS